MAQRRKKSKLFEELQSRPMTPSECFLSINPQTFPLDELEGATKEQFDKTFPVIEITEEQRQRFKKLWKTKLYGCR